MSKTYSVRKIKGHNFEDTKKMLGIEWKLRDNLSILRTVSNVVDDEKVGRKIAQKLIRTMVERCPNSVGLAAPQCGVDARVFIMRPFRGGKFRIVINPQITNYSDEKMGIEEGCMSVPNVIGMVERPREIAIVYSDGNKIVTETLRDIEAIIFQHEYDHLEGILYTDKAKKLAEWKK